MEVEAREGRREEGRRRKKKIIIKPHRYSDRSARHKQCDRVGRSGGVLPSTGT